MASVPSKIASTVAASPLIRVLAKLLGMTSTKSTFPLRTFLSAAGALRQPAAFTISTIPSSAMGITCPWAQ